MTTEERIEKAKNRIVQALTSVDNMIGILIKNNAISISKQEELEVVIINLKSELATLRNDKNELMKREQTISQKHETTNHNISNQESHESSNQQAFSNDENLFSQYKTERLTDKNASEYIDISINQLKSLIKHKNKR